MSFSTEETEDKGLVCLEQKKKQKEKVIFQYITS